MTALSSCQPNALSVESGQADGPLAVRVALLVNMISPYELPVLTELSRRVAKLTVLVSTPMESNRNWRPDFGSLDVRVQRTWTWQGTWRHATGFRDRQFVHFPWDTFAQLRSLRPDAILSYELGFRSASSALYRVTHNHTRLVLRAALSEHTERGRGLLRRLLRHWLIRRADAFAVNGTSAARYLQTMGCAPRRTFHVPYVAIETSLYHGPPTRSGAAAHRLIYVGQLVERKGILPFTERLVRWAAGHADRQVEFVIVGSGPLQPALAALPLPANLSLRMLGERSAAEMPDVWSEAGILVIPTLADEWALVVNEAMASGLPVLGSLYSQAVLDLCRDGETGWTFRPDAPHEVERAIDQAMAASPQQLDAMRASARRQVEHLTPGYAAAQLVRAIRCALHPARAEP